jgi:hypothetical protein
VAEGAGRVLAVRVACNGARRCYARRQCVYRLYEEHPRRFLLAAARDARGQLVLSTDEGMAPGQVRLGVVKGARHAQHCSRAWPRDRCAPPARALRHVPPPYTAGHGCSPYRACSVPFPVVTSLACVGARAGDPCWASCADGEDVTGRAGSGWAESCRLDARERQEKGPSPSRSPLAEVRQLGARERRARKTREKDARERRAR